MSSRSSSGAPEQAEYSDTVIPSLPVLCVKWILGDEGLESCHRQWPWSAHCMNGDSGPVTAHRVCLERYDRLRHMDSTATIEVDFGQRTQFL